MTQLLRFLNYQNFQEKNVHNFIVRSQGLYFRIQLRIQCLDLARCLYYGALLGLLSCKSDSWRRCTCKNVLFSLVAFENCLQVCFVGLVIERISLWCFVIVLVFIVWRMLKSHQLGVAMQVTKAGLFSQGRQVLTM